MCYNCCKYMVKYKVCSYCNAEYTGVSKTSRRDNKTEICSVCADLEALRDILTQTFKDRVRQSSKRSL